MRGPATASPIPWRKLHLVCAMNIHLKGRKRHLLVDTQDLVLKAFRCGYEKGMAKEIMSDKLWETIKPLLPGEPPKPNCCRLQVDDRAEHSPASVSC